MNTEILNRKGARKVKDIPKNIVKLLNEGKIETVNLTEWLAIDHSKLIESTFSSIGISKDLTKLIPQEIKRQKKPSTINSVKLIGQLLYENISTKKERQKIYQNLSAHISDSVRCYAPFLISLNTNLALSDKFNQIKPLVADKHFGIREVVWIAIRPEITTNLKESIELLSTWTEDKDENIRRFTTEATRPRGVWCKHIEALKEKPALALPILEKLKSDSSKYVQDSVGNWLNDASKSVPGFVIAICEKWKKESPTKETEKIIKRARRTIDKNKNHFKFSHY